MLNQHFRNTGFGGTNNNEFNLVEDLIVESIKQYGIDVQYMPRTEVDMDHLFGEDPLVAFNSAPTVEMYIKNVEGFEGQGDFLSRFGLEIRDSMTLTVAQRRFNQFQSEKLMGEQGFNMLLETGDMFEMETATDEGYTVNLTRPREADLIAFTIDGVTSIWEVKFVEHESVFYQLGRLYVYDLQVELFDYSSERFDTGNAIIDGVEDALSADALFYEILLEDDTKLLKEDGGSFILENYSLETTDAQADNDKITDKIVMDSIVDWSESDPFSDGPWV